MDLLVETVYLVHSIDSLLYPSNKVDSGMNFLVFLLFMSTVGFAIAYFTELSSKRTYVRAILQSAKIYTGAERGLLGLHLVITQKRKYRIDDEIFSSGGQVQYSYEELVRIIPDMFERYHSEKVTRSRTKSSSSSSSRSSYTSQDTSLRVAMAFLGLPMTATLEEVKKKYRELAKQYHPDTGGDKEKFIKLNTAYEHILKARSK